MKIFNLKKSFLAIVMLTATISFAKTDDGTATVQTMDVSISNYVNLIKYGDLSNFNKIFTDDAKFSISANGKTTSHSKSEEYGFLAKNKGITQQCEVLSAVVVNTESYTLVKVSQVYDTFTRENYITLVKAGKDWKINSVSSEYK
ncbi:nuclear transport factor 2 family protein [Pedobacter arcticus]|uniref:nuclear transport factor 2 family protein n=1 Tax=Pedobacter arcticus TaxID=752140 RepID=UPI0002E28171|nr:nuclear transport factor 2 family protein [Pedobacter arcticus]